MSNTSVASILLDDIGHLAGETLDQDIQMRHLGEHGLDPVRIHVDILQYPDRLPLTGPEQISEFYTPRVFDIHCIDNL
jgi:hypothetical protein